MISDLIDNLETNLDLIKQALNNTISKGQNIYVPNNRTPTRIP
jgi:hypothetical protein